ncbi:two-component system response regulator [Sphingomonas sp. Root1294]|nr:two-component system response regulator [Sphingomonas sp. Root1294]
MKTCLVVDDSKVIRKVARHILEALHFNVEEAGDGREALDRCHAGDLPDVILLDWNMPVMSGMEFLRSLGSDFVQRPADEYMMKPFDRETLESKLHLVGVA